MKRVFVNVVVTGLLLLISAYGIKADEKEGLRNYSFEELGWSTRENFGYQFRLLKGSDGELLGVILRLRNSSPNAPIKLTTLRDTRRFTVDISIEGKSIVTQSARDKEKAVDGNAAPVPVEWTLPPKTSENYFMPVRDLVPATFDSRAVSRCKLFIYLTAGPEGLRLGHGAFPPLHGIAVTITEKSFSGDEKLFKEAVNAGTQAR